MCLGRGKFCPTSQPRRLGARCGDGVVNATDLAIELLDSVRSAFVDGMDIMLWACGGIALGCALPAVIFLRKLR